MNHWRRHAGVPATLRLATCDCRAGRRAKASHGCRILRLLFVPARPIGTGSIGTVLCVVQLLVRKAEITAVRDGLAVSPARVGPFTVEKEAHSVFSIFHFLFLVKDKGEAFRLVTRATATACHYWIFYIPDDE